MGEPTVQVIILARDRRDFLRETLRSVCAQDVQGFDVLVSDNSETNAVEQLIATEFPQLRYTRRQPTLAALDHFRTVIAESSADYVVFFHDDDVMLPGFIRILSRALDANPGVSGVAGNATILQTLTQTAQYTTMGPVAQARKLDGAEAIARAYLTRQMFGVAAFPGYMYRRRTLEGLYLDPDQGGKYADVSFLMKLAARAPLLWLPDVTMHYRIHNSNDSRRESIPQLLKLLQYIYQSTSIRRDSELIAEYRFRYWLRWWRQRQISANRNTAWRSHIVARYLLRRGLNFVFTRPSLCWRFLVRQR
ncbi:MAG TPA: glycosyltransferase family 2 protein [Rhodocyclaceae bacterium]|nr:glycosyltransferase family 2 protein [Rhodocyclaceae bacterium]